MAAGLLGSVLLHAAVLSALGPAPSADRSVVLARLEAATESALPLPSAELESSHIAPAVDQPLAANERAESSRQPLPAESASESPPIALPFTEHFFKSSELDQQPYPLVDVAPIYPPHAAATELEGWVRLLLLIDEAGTLRRLEVVQASPSGIFDEAALTAFRGAQFSPGRRGEAAVKSRMIVKVDFTLERIRGAAPK